MLSRILGMGELSGIAASVVVNAMIGLVLGYRTAGMYRRRSVVARHPLLSATLFAVVGAFLAYGVEWAEGAPAALSDQGLAGAAAMLGVWVYVSALRAARLRPAYDQGRQHT